MLENNSQSIVATILGKRQQNARWVFFVASLPFILFAFWGNEYGAFPLYLFLGVVCLIQIFYPTLLGWAIISVLYLLGSVVYLYVIIKDIFNLAGEGQPWVFVDYDDTIIFWHNDIVNFCTGNFFAKDTSH